MTARADVLLIANNFPPVRGGSAVVYQNLANQSGGRLMVLAPRISYTDGLPLIGWREHDRRATYRVVRLPLLRTVISEPHGRRGRLLFLMKDMAIRANLAFALVRLLIRERPRAICIGELMASSWIVRVLACVPHVRTVIYVHGEEITTEDPYDLHYARRRRALLAGDGIVVVSRFTQSAVETLLPEQARGRIALIENGVDTDRFRAMDKSPWLTALYGLDGYFVFVSVCRLLEKKGIDQALRAFAGLLPRHPMSRFLVVGTGPYGDRLRAIAAELGITGAVIFTGEIPENDLVEHYCLGDVFVMPNRELPNGDTEGFGLVFLEANACGLPVIAGRDGGSRDAVRHGENGLVVNGHCVGEILAAMLLLREDDAERAKLRRGGLIAAARADWKNKAQTFLQFCLSGRPSGHPG
ncbi:MAG: glycosyltransferase family 4 protein [Acetobacteraceae bacterium]